MGCVKIDLVSVRHVSSGRVEWECRNCQMPCIRVVTVVAVLSLYGNMVPVITAPTDTNTTESDKKDAIFL